MKTEHEQSVEILALLEAQAEQGDPISMYDVAVRYEELAIKSKDKAIAQIQWSKAVEWYKRSANRGNSLAHYNLGLIYGKGITYVDDKCSLQIVYVKDLEESKRQLIAWTTAHQAGDILFIISSNTSLLKGCLLKDEQKKLEEKAIGTDSSIGKELKAINQKDLATYDKGRLIALLKANIFFEGHILIAQNDLKALIHFECGADLGHSRSAYSAGLYYLRGWGVTKDIKKAGYFFQLTITLAQKEEMDNEILQVIDLAEKKLGELNVAIEAVATIPNLALQSIFMQDSTEQISETTQPEEETTQKAPETLEDELTQFYFTRAKDQENLIQQQQKLRKRSSDLVEKQFDIANYKKLIKTRELYLNEREHELEKQVTLLTSQKNSDNNAVVPQNVQEELQQLYELKERLEQERNALEQEKKLLKADELRLARDQELLTRQKDALEQYQLQMENKFKEEDESLKQRESELKIQQQEIFNKLDELHQKSHELDKKISGFGNLKLSLKNEDEGLKKERDSLKSDRAQWDKDDKEFKKALSDQRYKDAKVIELKLMELDQRKRAMDERENNLQGREQQLASRTAELEKNIKKLQQEKAQLAVKEKELQEQAKVVEQKDIQFQVLQDRYQKAQKAVEAAAREANLAKQKREQAEKAEWQAKEANRIAREAEELVKKQIEITQGKLSPLANAVRCKDSKLVTHLLKMGYNPNLQDELGLTALHLAVMNADKKTVNALLEDKRTNPNIVDKDGKLPLHFAAEKGDISLIHVLIKNPFNIGNLDKRNTKANTKDKSGKLPADYLPVPSSFNLLGKKSYEEAKKLLDDAKTHADGLLERIKRNIISEIGGMETKKNFQVEGLLKQKPQLEEEDIRNITGSISTLTDNLKKEINNTLLLSNEKAYLHSLLDDHLEKTHQEFEAYTDNYNTMSMEEELNDSSKSSRPGYFSQPWPTTQQIKQASSEQLIRESQRLKRESQELKSTLLNKEGLAAEIAIANQEREAAIAKEQAKSTEPQAVSSQNPNVDHHRYLNVKDIKDTASEREKSAKNAQAKLMKDLKESKLESQQTPKGDIARELRNSENLISVLKREADKQEIEQNELEEEQHEWGEETIIPVTEAEQIQVPLSEPIESKLVNHRKFGSRFALWNTVDAEDAQAYKQQTGREVPASHKGLIRLDTLGKGGFSKVRLARDVKTAKFIAVKKIKGNEAKVLASKDEADIQKQLIGETHILQLLGSFSVKDRNGLPAVYHFLPLIDCNGEELKLKFPQITAEKLKQSDFKRQTPQQFIEKIIINIAYACLDALDRMHKKRICHRDLKPANIFLYNAGEFCIGDFGQAIQLEELTTEEQLATGRKMSLIMKKEDAEKGDMDYWAPEQWQCKRQGFWGGFDGSKADIWMLGISLLEFILGKNPFGSTMDEEEGMIVCDNRYFSEKLNQIKLLQAAPSGSLLGLIRELTQPDPQKRITVEQALKYPIFSAANIFSKEESSKFSDFLKNLSLPNNNKQVSQTTVPYLNVASVSQTASEAQLMGQSGIGFHPSNNQFTEAKKLMQTGNIIYQPNQDQPVAIKFNTRQRADEFVQQLKLAGIKELDGADKKVTSSNDFGSISHTVHLSKDDYNKIHQNNNAYAQLVARQQVATQKGSKEEVSDKSVEPQKKR